MHAAAKNNNWNETSTKDLIACKRDFKKLCRWKQRSYWVQLKKTLNSASNQQAFWKAIKPFKGKQSRPCVISEEEWKEFYSNSIPERCMDPTLFYGPLHPNLDLPFTPLELSTAIAKLANNKSPGPDGITNEFLKALPSEGLTMLLDCYNEILCTENTPEEWYSSITVMIHKKGDMLNPNNYRPIALLSCMLKLFTQLLYNRLASWATQCNILPEAQGGFRAQRGTDDQIFVLNAAITLGTRHKASKVYAVFFDFARAFPSIPHHKLWAKLNDLGVSPKLIRILRRIYENSNTQIRMQNTYTEPIDMTIGLLQGEILSPILFSLYIADIEETMKSSPAGGITITRDLILHMLLYADDMVVLSNTETGLKCKIRILQKYFINHDLKVHMDKTKIIIFRRAGRLPKNLCFKYDGEVIGIVKQYTYLGVPFSSSGVFYIASKHFKSKGLTALGAAWSIMTKARLEKMQDKYNLFSALVSSTVLYGAHIWGLRYMDEIEKAQYAFHRKLLGLPYGSPAYAMRLELNRPMLSSRLIKQALRFLLKIQHMDDSRYVKQCYNALVQAASIQPDKLNWVQQLQEITNSALPLTHSPEITPADIRQAIPNILQVMEQQQKEKDEARVTKSDRFNYYSTIQPTPGQAATYITLPIPLAAIRTIAQARLGRGSFFTPTGLVSVDYNSICDICNMKEQATLNHILCHCPLNSGPRHSFFLNKPLPFRQNDYLAPECKNDALKVSRFITSCLAQIQEIPPN